MSTGKTGELWVDGLKGLLGVREDGAILYVGGYSLTTAALSNVAAESDQFVPASGKVLTLSNTGTIAGGDAWTLAIAAAKTLTVSNTGTIAGGDAWNLAIAAAKTLTVSNSLTFAGTDATTMTFPSTSATVARTDAANTFTGAQTFTSIVLGAGAVIDVDYAAVSATGNDTTQTATITKACGAITTGSLTTAAGASTAVALTLTGVVAGDPVLISKCGGTNTRTADDFSVITTTDTITVTLRNIDLINALNGTVKFNYLWLKA